MANAPTTSPAADNDEAVVYLDVDGVLRTKRSNHKHVTAQLKKTMPNLVSKDGAFDPIAVASLNAITDETGAKLVICSSHRDNVRIKKMLKDAGVTGQFHKDWRTPKLSHESSPTGGVDTRGREIDAHRAANPSIKHWVWIDNEDESLPTQKENLVLVSDVEGLSPADADQALEILGHKPHDIRRVRFERRVDQAKRTAALARQLLPKN